MYDGLYVACLSVATSPGHEKMLTSYLGPKDAESKWLAPEDCTFGRGGYSREILSRLSQANCEAPDNSVELTATCYHHKKGHLASSA